MATTVQPKPWPPIKRADLLAWLRETDPQRLEVLWQQADWVRRQNVGDAVHLRGLIEISNHCVRRCGYCGIRAGNKTVERYRMSTEEILDCGRLAHDLGYGTVVLQAGEDDGITAAGMTDIVRCLKRDTPLAVTLSLGERSPAELTAWRNVGADRYLLRFETSDARLYRRIHPPRPGQRDDRFALLATLRQLGYEVGSGVMVGIPGQTYETLAEDLEMFRRLDLDMIGIGPFIAHPQTPLGRRLAKGVPIAPDQVPATEELTCKAVALARLLCPQANIPATTALATINQADGREHGLTRGANVVMPNLTPVQYRRKYEIYPAKACISERATDCAGCLRSRIERLGRQVGAGPGGRVHSAP